VDEERSSGLSRCGIVSTSRAVRWAVTSVSGSVRLRVVAATPGGALAAVLPEARARGLERVVAIWDASYTASARTVERNGGLLEAVIETDAGPKRRYWIDL
jgi:predicted acetyltransferase